MKPTGTNILFKPFAPKDTTAGGLYVPDSCKDVPDMGTIVAVGRGTAKQPMKLKEGMIGHRVKGWGEEIIIEGETHFLMDSKAIIAIE